MSRFPTIKEVFGYDSNGMLFRVTTNIPVRAGDSICWSLTDGVTILRDGEDATPLTPNGGRITDIGLHYTLP